MARGLALPWTGLVAVVLLGAGCSYDEGYFHRKVKKLDELAARGSATAKQRIEKRKSELLRAFKDLPRGQGRQKALDELCRRARKTADEAEQILAGQAVDEKKVDKSKLAAYQKKFIGHWEGENMKLVIADNGKVDYERKKPNGSTSKMNAFILDFHYHRFKVGFMGLGTSFRIDKAPYQEGGKWKMKIDGVDLTRVGGSSGPQYGTFVCTRYEEGRCLDPATEFDGGKLEKLHLLYVTRDVPEKGQKHVVTWIAEEVGKAAPSNYKIAETPLTYDGKDQQRANYFTVHAHLTRPDKGWPVGRYRVEVHTRDKVVASVKYQIRAAEAPAPSEKSP